MLSAHKVTHRTGTMDLTISYYEHSHWLVSFCAHRFGAFFFFFWTLGYDRMLIMSAYIDLWLLRSITSARSDWCCYYEQCSPTMWTGLVLFVTLVTTIHVYLCYDHLTLTCDCFWAVCAYLVGVLWTLGTTISYYKHLHPLVSFFRPICAHKVGVCWNSGYNHVLLQAFAFTPECCRAVSCAQGWCCLELVL